MAENNVDMLVEMALADQNTIRTQVKSTTLKLRCITFINSNPAKGTTVNVEDVYPAGKAHGQIVSAFKKVITASGLSKLVWVLPLSDEDGTEHVKLIALTDPPEDNDDENEVGVEVEDN